MLQWLVQFLGKKTLFTSILISTFTLFSFWLRSREFLFFSIHPCFGFKFLYLKLCSHTTTNMLYQLKQLDLWLFWKRHSMVHLQFGYFRWDNLYLKGYVLFRFINLFMVIILFIYALVLSCHRLRSNLQCNVQSLNVSGSLVNI